MGKQKGFTLIELLVVIAIIAVLVALVLVAIDPVKRIRDTQNRVAASNVRSTGTLLAVCVTQVIADGSTTAYSDCDNDPIGEVASYGNVPGDVEVADSANDVCAAQQGSPGPAGLGTYYVYKYSTGQVKDNPGELPVDPTTWCPDV